MKYNKLVRDKIPEIIESDGRICVTHIADDLEYWQSLKDKLQEEVLEFLQEENKEELADIFEVINAICDCNGFNKQEIEQIMEKKAQDRGRFQKRIILEETH